ncbi:MAG TPA: hypothetical protein VGC62_20955 [Pseudomonas sp.]|uniref:hypothetical protein n=1 Tax=Pseudomonas sp. TaxID=306 RepID=UPI002EDB4F91
MPSFYDYFKENMESLGLPAPQSLFGSMSAAVATATTILSQVEKFGKTVTLREIISAGTRLEQLTIIGACSAAFYVGAVIGSIAVALGRTLGNGTSLSDVMFMARTNGLYKEWLPGCFQTYPGIYLTNISGAHYRLGGYLG